LRLGSGLDPRKLAETIVQIAPDNDGPLALICDAPGFSHGWIHLSAGVPDDPAAGGWMFQAGFPTSQAPAEALTSAGFPLVGEIEVVAWEPNLYVSLRLPSDLPADAIARLIVATMRHLQHVPQQAEVRVALE
jgi:hypothetical protein